MEALQQLKDNDASESDFNLYGLLPVDDDHHFHDSNNHDNNHIKKKTKQEEKEKKKAEKLKLVKGPAGADKTRIKHPKPPYFRQYYHPNTYTRLSEMDASRVDYSNHITHYSNRTTLHYISHLSHY